MAHCVVAAVVLLLPPYSGTSTGKVLATPSTALISDGSKVIRILKPVFLFENVTEHRENYYVRNNNTHKRVFALLERQINVHTV